MGGGREEGVTIIPVAFLGDGKNISSSLPPLFLSLFPFSLPFLFPSPSLSFLYFLLTENY
jgi:hypothetical protein